ncbi:hypothetical protein MLD38_001709 [Melastoma candidum]|uniref:Uncharacterized protein n=1 Tax=Melastoma candidum TaxID=119954 RepID=A0ACB9SE11_9MYRT|nr:hypothetical protein MLD38_001709 [Melastoma candidum]
MSETTPFLFLVLSLLTAAVSSGSGELDILLALPQTIQSSATPNPFSSWIPAASPCNFVGIKCDQNGSVTELDLSRQWLVGTVNFTLVCALPSLEKLALGFNSLGGNVLADLDRCSKLRYLDLGNNRFSGSFPEIPSLVELQYLYLNKSGLSGAFPWGSLRSMPNLVALSVGDNRFEPSPFPLEVLDLLDLNWLYMTNCSIQGKIPPGIGRLTKLINLELSVNNISGEIPNEIGNLMNLWQLELYRNNLTGRFPPGMRNLIKLEKFDASRNNLQGDLSELSNLTNLVTLQLFVNNLSGGIPPEFGNFQKLVNLSLYTNQLTGPLPEMLGSWAEFNYIDVSENFLTGRIPPNMCNRGKMKELLVLQNNLSGEIPATYTNCSTLTRFRVSNNSLTGVVPPGLWGLPNVNIIDLEMNKFEGGVTSDIQNAKALGQLFLANNKFSGDLPEEISKAESLVAIHVSNNGFTGRLPQSIGELKKLSSLHVENNMFSGLIPESLGSCDSISDVNMANNSLSGEIPASLGSLPVLNSLNLSDNLISGSIPSSLSLLRLSLLDLSNNRLTGQIPESLSIQAYNGSFAGNPGLCSYTISSFRQCSYHPGMSKDIHMLIVCFSLLAVLLCLCLGFCFYINKREKKRGRSLKEDLWDVKSFRVLSFTEDEILESIKPENLIGRGASGNVYRVVLANGKELAVKHIWNTDCNNQKKARATTPILGTCEKRSREFEAEVETLSSIRHVNVVKLYCSITSDDSSLLVYEYLPNGSLWDRLHTSRKVELDWETRYDIAVGAAKGLEYLHHGCEKPVLHRDVKSSNILLDEFMKPRIADFGLAKILQVNGGKDSTHIIAGTHGYIAPEYGYTYKVNEKSDVYSFGVVLMELVTGKRPIEAEFGDYKDIVSWVSGKLKTRESVLSMVDLRIPEAFKDDAIKVLRVAILCTATLPNLRPAMRSVVHMLEEAEPCKIVGIIIEEDENVKSKAIQPVDAAKVKPES